MKYPAKAVRLTCQASQWQRERRRRKQCRLEIKPSARGLRSRSSGRQAQPAGRVFNDQGNECVMKVLMVLTSHDLLGNTGRKTGFWLEELAAPYYVFKD